MKITYLPFEKYKEPQKLINIWNQAFNHIYPIDIKQFEQNTYLNPDISPKSSFVALDDNEPVGFIATKVYKNNAMLSKYQNQAYINALAVLPDYQKKGIGSDLLNMMENSLEEKMIHVCRDTYNYFPGIPFDFIDTKKWFEKRHYVNKRHTHDLIIDIQNKKFLKMNEKKAYQFRYASIDDKDSLLMFFKTHFPGRWEYECYQYFKNGGKGNEYLLVLIDNQIIGFCRCNHPEMDEIPNNLNWRLRFNKLGGIGPLGIDRAYRNQGLGTELIVRAMNALKEKDTSQIIIDWTSLIDYYRKFGFEVWKAYYYMSKER